MKQDMIGILQRGLNQVKSNLGLQGSRQILYLNDLLNTESKHNKANSAMTAILYEIHNNGRERGITSLIRFTLKDIQKKVIKKTCSLFTLNLFTIAIVIQHLTFLFVDDCIVHKNQSDFLFLHYHIPVG